MRGLQSPRDSAIYDHDFTSGQMLIQAFAGKPHASPMCQQSASQTLTNTDLPFSFPPLCHMTFNRSE